MNAFLHTLTSRDAAERNRPFAELAAGMSTAELLQACEELDSFRRQADNLYERVRAAQFLYAAYRFQLMESPEMPAIGVIPYEGFEDLLARRFEEAICALSRRAQERTAPTPRFSARWRRAITSSPFRHSPIRCAAACAPAAAIAGCFASGMPMIIPCAFAPTLLRRAGRLAALSRAARDARRCGWI